MADNNNNNKHPEDVLTKDWSGKHKAGHILDAGNAEYYDTGTWGTFEPVLHEDICIQCLRCWVACPDSAILVNEESEVIGFDLKHCKGCAICAEICPTKPEKAITMEKKNL